MCTGLDGTARGNEAVKQCADGHWCCYNNRSVDCCDDESKEIDLPSGSPTRTITTPPNPTSDDSGGGGGSSSSEASTTSTPDSSSSSSTSTSTSSEPPPSPIPTTFTTQEATTNSQGVATTIIHTSIATYTPPPFPSPTSSSENSSNSNTPLIAGLAAGLPAGLTLAAILLFLLYRRRKNTQNQLPPSHQPSTDTDISHLKPMYTNTTPDGRPPELDSYPVAVGTKPGHMSQISELSGSSPYQQHSSPAVSSMHSPQQSPFVGGGVVGGLGQVKEEKHEPVELPGDSISHTQDWARKRSSYPGQPSYTYPYPTSEAQRPASQQYVAYRPPQEAPPVSPMSPRTDVDHGELERGELKIMNPDVDS